MTRARWNNVLAPVRLPLVSAPLGPLTYCITALGALFFGLRHASIPAGESEQTVIINGSIRLKGKFRSVDSGSAVGDCWLGRCDKPNTVDKIVEKAIQRKVPKLVRTNADKKVLLLQREHISMSDTEILAEIEKLARQHTDLAKIDEIWFADTSILESEGWVYLSRLHRGPTEIVGFHNGVRKHRRDDRDGINEDVSSSGQFVLGRGSLSDCPLYLLRLPIK
jgi:hypothetical protein